jgi:putative hydrolase of HD superfamily
MQKNKSPAEYLPNVTHIIVRLYMEFFHLKQIYRKGWLLRGVKKKKCESDADHTLGMVVLAILIYSRIPEIDVLKLLQMIVIHEWCEIDAGDNTPHCNISKEEKYQREYACIKRIFTPFPGEELYGFEKYIKIWEEFEEGKTLEAQIAKKLDKLEMILTALAYELHGYADLSEFYSERVMKLLDTPELESIMWEIEQIRKINLNQT